MPHAIVIGSGLGGLATALRLRHAGYDVTVFERGSRPGGRSNVIESDGFRMDTGPTLLLMRDVFEKLYADIDCDFNARVPLSRLDPNYRLYFHDGEALDLHADREALLNAVEAVEAGAGDALTRLLALAEDQYTTGMRFITRNYDRFVDLVTVQNLFDLVRLRAHRRLYPHVAGYFQSDKLRKAFTFHSMFLGLSPYDSLALYSLLTHADIGLGMWFPKGGIYTLIEDMVTLAEAHGITLVTHAPVEQITVEQQQVTGVQLANGEQVLADLVVSNADLPYTYLNLLPKSAQHPPTANRYRRMDYACSGYLLYLGLEGTFDHLVHQSLFFSADYRANLDAIFKTRTLPTDPSFHMSVPTISDPALAPAGHTLIYILVPAPNTQNSPVDWSQSAPVLREQILDHLERLIAPDLRQRIVWERQLTPPGFSKRFNAVHGTAFGSFAQGFMQTTYFRPHNKDKHIRNLYYVGQGTYPGIGMPLVMMSADVVTQRILADQG